MLGRSVSASAWDGDGVAAASVRPRALTRSRHWRLEAGALRCSVFGVGVRSDAGCSGLRHALVGMGYRFVEHGGEVELAIEATSEPGVFEGALEAFAELVSPVGAGGAAEREVELHRFELSAGDRGLLLVDWLGELVFLAETEEFVPERLVMFELVGDRLRACVAGRRGHPRQLVKGITLNSLEFGREGGAWRGRVVFDV